MAYTPKNANGQATMANSSPVVIASDQTSIPVTDNSGSLTVDNGGTFAVQENGAALTALQLIDDTVATLGTTTYSETTTKGLIMGAVRRDADTTMVDTTNEVAPLQVNASGALKTALTAAIPAGSNVIGALTANQSVNVAQIAGNTLLAGNGVSSSGVQRVTIASDSTGNIATIGTSVTPGTAAANLGKARDAVAGASDTAVGALFVRRDTPTAVTPAAGDYEFAQISANGEQWVRDVNNIADDAAFTLGTSTTHTMGGVAVNMDGTDPLSVSAESDEAALRTDPNRILLVNQTHPRYFRASADYASAQTNASVVAAPGASLSLWITDVIISNGATAGNITLLDGSGGSVVLELYPGVNGGLAHSFRNPIKLTANTALCITSTTVTTHSVTVTGYIAA